MILIATVSGALFLFFLYAGVRPWVMTLLRDPALAPDGPEPFGAGNAWLAIQTVDIDQVIAILGLHEVAACNWQSGLSVAEDPDYSNAYVFVTPPVDGWTFVVGMALPHPAGRDYTDQCLSLQLSLGKTFRDVQYFYACPILDLVAWSRFSDAKLRRSFAWGDEGIIWNKGALTSAERALGLKVFPTTSTTTLPPPANDIDEDERGYPEPEHVLRMAASWSVNPETFTRLPGDPALGYIGRMPDTWRVRRVASRSTIVEPHSTAAHTSSRNAH